jgi:hypothetical protein
MMEDALSQSATTPLRFSNGPAIETCVAAAVTLAVVLILANPPGANILLFDGGWRDGLFGAAMVALIPLTIMFQIGLGALLVRMFVIPVERMFLLSVSRLRWRD